MLNSQEAQLPISWFTNDKTGFILNVFFSNLSDYQDDKKDHFKLLYTFFI